MQHRVEHPVRPLDLVLGAGLDVLDNRVAVTLALGQQGEDQRFARCGHKFLGNHARTIHSGAMYVKHLFSTGGGRMTVAHFTSEVQWGQRVALIGMVEKQRGHSFVVGSAATGACSSRCFMVFIALMTRKIQNATMRKSMIVLMNEP